MQPPGHVDVKSGARFFIFTFFFNSTNTPIFERYFHSECFLLLSWEDIKTMSFLISHVITVLVLLGHLSFKNVGSNLGLQNMY